MVIQKINEMLQSSEKPVSRFYYKSRESKTIFIGFKKCMTLDQHKTHQPAKLMAITGKVTYIQAGDKATLGKYEYKDVPVNIIHEVFAEEDSLCMLIHG